MECINISDTTVTIERAVKKTVPNPKGADKPDLTTWAYREIVLKPGEILDMDNYAKPRKPMSTVEMLSNGKVVPITDPRAQEYLEKHGRPAPGTEDKFAVQEGPFITSSEFADKLAELGFERLARSIAVPDAAEVPTIPVSEVDAKISEIEAKNDKRIRDLESLVEELLAKQDSAQAAEDDPDEAPDEDVEPADEIEDVEEDSAPASPAAPAPESKPKVAPNKGGRKRRK